MKVTDYRSDRLFVFLSLRVAEARELAPDEYNSYFDKLYELISVINKYHENELSLKTENNGNDKTAIKTEFKGLLDVFLKMDMELFGE